MEKREREKKKEEEKSDNKIYFIKIIFKKYVLPHP